MKGLFDLSFRFVCYGFLIVIVSACSSFSSLFNVRSSIPDLITSEGTIGPEQAYAASEQYDLLRVSDEMLAFTDSYISRSMPQYQRAELLNTVLRGSAFLNIVYNIEGTFTAEQVFLNESANCVGYANLYIALARHYGLDAKYQLIKKFPQWNRETGKGETIMSLANHINSVIKLNGGRNIVVDLAPRIGRQVGSPKVISDKEAEALFYNNLSIDQVIEQNYAKAYGLIVRAITAEPESDALWVNLGTILRRNGQLNDAESVFKHALALNPNAYTAMNNLAVLYQRKQDWEQFDYYLNKTREYRRKNPYYHFQLAKIAEEEKDYALAITHIKDAIKLKSSDPEFYATLKNLNRLMASNSLVRR